MIWTNERLAEAARLRANGMKWREVASTMGISLQSVKNACNRYGLATSEKWRRGRDD